MIEYTYKGFKISYTIEPQDKALYVADGSATCMRNPPTVFTPTKFHTEFNSYVGAEQEIKKLLENYVNFELKNFYAMKQEKS